MSTSILLLPLRLKLQLISSLSKLYKFLWPPTYELQTPFFRYAILDLLLSRLWNPWDPTESIWELDFRTLALNCSGLRDLNASKMNYLLAQTQLEFCYNFF